MKNLFKYCKEYSGHDPKLLEDDVFRFILPVTPQVTPQAERIKDIIEFCATPRSREEIQKHINIQDREYFRKNILSPLLEKEILKQTIPEKTTSPKQKYYSNVEGTND